jgi:ATP-dependent RNA/DNA helicase IGHMBP2
MSSRRRLKSTSAESEQHFVDMAEWLAMESAAEIKRMEERRRIQNTGDAENSGETILDVVVTDEVRGLGGHQLVTFKRRNETLQMPWHRLRVGAPVVVSPFRRDGKAETGVVSRKRNDSIQIALNRTPRAEVLRIDLTADEVTRQRQLAAIMTAKDSRGRLGHLRAILMGEKQPRFSDKSSEIDFKTQLNESQKAAVKFALAAEDLAIIHGPPGTGKTTTVAELIVQAIRQSEKVLACAPSNTAVDNLLEKLVQAGMRVVRIGHPARITERLRNYSLDGLVEQHENTTVIKDMIREAEALFRQSEKWTRAKPQRGVRESMKRDAKRLMADAKRLERQAISSILDQADVICATTTFNPDILDDRWFDLAVIDEACQSTEPGCWVPLLRSERVVLAGDHQQLPPTVLSSEAAQQGFAKSMMERQIELYGDDVAKMLTVQYRMHRQIMDFSSEQFYQDELQAHPSVVDHTLHGIEGIAPSEFTKQIISFIDTAGAGWEEELEPNGLSKRNPNEAHLVVKKVKTLLDAGLPKKDIAVIAPYAAQVRLLRDLFEGEGPEVDTVDGFQGREKEAVVISLVRSNPQNEIGFLADRRRMNVALTRARRKLIVIGDSATLGIDKFYRDFFEYVELMSGYQTVWTEN